MPAGVATEMSIEARAREIVREQLFERIHKELPYSTQIVFNREQHLK